VRDRLSAQNLTARLKVTSTLDAPQAAPTLPDPLAWFEPRVAPTFTPLTAPPAASEDRGSRIEDRGSGREGPATPAAMSSFDPRSSILDPRSSLPPVKAIQLHNAYLVLETAEGMLVIDQHALHERILFEQLKRRIRSGTLEVQPLLLPEPVEFSADQAARALEYRDALAELGVGIEPFGGGTLLLSSYPALLGN